MERENRNKRNLLTEKNDEIFSKWAREYADMYPDPESIWKRSWDYETWVKEVAFRDGYEIRYDYYAYDFADSLRDEYKRRNEKNI